MIYKKRRQKLLKQLEKDSIVVITTNSQKLRNGDVYYPFRADSNFLYMSGFDEPESVIVISTTSYTVFLREKNKTKEIWEGVSLGVMAAPQVLMADKAFTIDSLEREIPKLIDNASCVYYNPKISQIDKTISKCLANIKYKQLTPYLNKMRLIKENSELDLMQKAVNISIKAHQMAMKQTQAGMYEFEISSIFTGYFNKNNAEHAYQPIVAAGKNACILHYIKNNQMLKKNELLLIDAGCEVGGYAADITRTFPINGKFSKAQKIIYQLVLKAQMAAINAIGPNKKINDMHKTACNVLKQGLIKLNILKKDEELSQFYMHNSGHFIGLDVHDIKDYKTSNDSKFKKGMVITVEPGIYIRKNAKINNAYWNIGVRIEDDVLVTEDGRKVLSSALVKKVVDIEAFMKK